MNIQRQNEYQTSRCILHLRRLLSFTNYELGSYVQPRIPTKGDAPGLPTPAFPLTDVRISYILNISMTGTLAMNSDEFKVKQKFTIDSSIYSSFFTTGLAMTKGRLQKTFDGRSMTTLAYGYGPGFLGYRRSDETGRQLPVVTIPTRRLDPNNTDTSTNAYHFV